MQSRLRSVRELFVSPQTGVKKKVTPAPAKRERSPELTGFQKVARRYYFVQSLGTGKTRFMLFELTHRVSNIIWSLFMISFFLNKFEWDFNQHLDPGPTWKVFVRLIMCTNLKSGWRPFEIQWADWTEADTQTHSTSSTPNRYQHFFWN